MIKNGKEKPNVYISIYNGLALGFETPIAITAARMGPVQGVHPAENPIPTRADTKKPVGLLLKLTFFSFKEFRMK